MDSKADVSESTTTGLKTGIDDIQVLIAQNYYRYIADT